MRKKYALIQIFVFSCVFSNAQLLVTDIFNRNLSGETIRLVDWEGYIANPAIKIFIQPPANTTFPLSVTLSANNSRLYFNMPSVAGSNGPSKSLSFNNSSPQNFYLSVFPDRAGGNENYTLTINSALGSQMFDILVLDHDSAAPTIDFNIITDHSQDIPAYNFFSVPSHTAIVKQATNDWAFFLGDMGFDTVPANDEQTWIWQDDFASGNTINNAISYNGFLLYAYGIHTAPHRSGGECSTDEFQTINNVNTPLRRSGGYEAEAHGNFNMLGWNNSITDSNWYAGTNLGNVQNDLYSIAIHEIGHALCFNSGYPNFQVFKNLGFINDSAVVAYQGAPVPVDVGDHLSANPLLTDRISRKGAFGSEYANQVPLGRWLISKLNLLVMQAVGYDLKETSAFRAVSILPANLSQGYVNSPFIENLKAEGGVPFYKFEVLSGNLPPGLSLNSFDGNISGTPTLQGTFTFTIKVTDYDNEISTRQFSIFIAPYTSVSENIYGKILLFPNPFRSFTILKLPIGTGEARLTINNMLGEEVQRMNLSEGDNIIESKNLATGIYYFVVDREGVIITGKLVVENN